MGKGEIARYEQFLLFPQCFQKACFPGASKGVIVWEWVNTLPDDKILDQTKFLLFPQCFPKASFPDASKGVIVWEWVNPLPNDKILDPTKLKAFTDDKFILILY